MLDGVQSAMRLADADLAPSRQVLYDYGNVSSSSTWYGLACIESLRGVAQGDRVVQIGVGSGVKVGGWSWNWGAMWWWWQLLLAHARLNILTVC